MILPEQFMMTVLADQASLSAAATTNQASLPTSNPGGTPGFSTSSASAHQPAYSVDRLGNARMDDTVLVWRDQDALPLQISGGGHGVLTVILVGLLGPSATPLDLGTLFPGSTGSLCIDLSAAPIDLPPSFDGFDADGYLTTTIPNSIAAPAEGQLQFLTFQGIMLDTATNNVHATGCTTLHFN